MYNEPSFHRYGTPLPPLEQDEVPSKKHIRPEDQIVTDENGKRRFHGAFTGGFSAGYWNTVGSQEGWTPASFKSSRTDKAPARAQLRPEDFMDAEDMGEFGIAPQRVQPRAEFTDDDGSRKRRYEPPSTGVIPGRPVLELLLQHREDKIGERIMKSMGWRPGQGVGPRLTREQKKQIRQRRRHEAYLNRHYGAQAVSGSLTDDSGGSSSDNEDSNDEITYAPDDYEPYVCQPKNDYFGLGYNEFLSRDPVLSQRPAKSSVSTATASAAGSGHINLFAPPPLQLVGKNNKTLSITGQAFGVGALEEDDDDIYERDDMTRYDFSLEDRKKPKVKKEIFVQDRAVIPGFQAAKNPPQSVPRHVVEVPEGFKPRNWLQRKNRFEPLDPERAKELERSFKKLDPRGWLTPQERGDMLNDITDRPMTSAQANAQAQAPTQAQAQAPTQAQAQAHTQAQAQAHTQAQAKTHTQAHPHAQAQAHAQTQPHAQSQHQAASSSRIDNIKRLTNTTQQLFARLAQIDKFTSGGVESPHNEEVFADQVAREQQELLQKARVKTKSLESTLTNMNFKPFITDAAKQKRYDEFLAANVTSEADIHAFLNEIQPIHLSTWDREMEKKEFMQAKNLYKPLDGSMAERFVSGANVQPEQKAAEQPKPNKSFKPERSRCTWKPASLLCRRFNIAEPHGGAIPEEKSRPRTKLSIFNYLEDSVNKRSDFQTPILIPKSMRSTHNPRPIVRHERKNKPQSCATDISSLSNKHVRHQMVNEAESGGADGSQSSDESRHTVPVKDSKSQGSVDIWLIPSSEAELNKSVNNVQKDNKPIPSASRLGRYKPKTVLEKLVEESRDKPAWDKVDIYHAIFDNSSDEDSILSGDNEPVEVTLITNSSSQTSEGNLPGAKNAASANVLRNNSPPRGIFKVLFPRDENEAGTPKEIRCADTHLDKEKLREFKSRLTDHLEHAKGPSKPKEKPIAADTAQPDGGPVRIVYQPKRERLGGAGIPVNSTITAPVYGPKMPDFFKSVSLSSSSETISVSSVKVVDSKLRRSLESISDNRLPTIEEEEWVEKKLTEDRKAEKDSSDSGSDSSTDGDSDSDSVVAKPKQKKRSKKRKHKKRNNKECVIKGKKAKKKSKKLKKSHKSKKSKESKDREKRKFTD